MSDFLQRLIPDSNRLDLVFANNHNGSTKTELLEDLYSAGFVGAFFKEGDCEGSDQLASWVGRVAEYLDREFMYDTPGHIKRFTEAQSSFALADGDGECYVNCRHALELYEAGGRVGVKPYSLYQDYGSCVDASAAEHTTSLLGWRAARSEFKEDYKHSAAWYWYAWRGYCSDGWSGSGVATQARRHGIAFRVKYQIGDNSVDFTDDDENENIVARKWCRNGGPAWLEEHTRLNHPFEDGAITAFDEDSMSDAKAALKRLFKAGGVLHHSGTRTSGGSKPFSIGSTGPHMQSAYGYDDTDAGRKFFRDKGFTIADDDFVIINGQTWGAGWRGETADEYWRPEYGPKAEGAWLWRASDMINRISLDYAWLPKLKGFPTTNPLPPPGPIPVVVIGGKLYVEEVGVVKAIRGEIVIPSGLSGNFIAVPDGNGSYQFIRKPSF